MERQLLIPSCPTEHHAQGRHDAEDPVEHVVSRCEMFCLEFAVPEEMAHPVHEEEQPMPYSRIPVIGLVRVDITKQPPEKPINQDSNYNS